MENAETINVRQGYDGETKTFRTLLEGDWPQRAAISTEIVAALDCIDAVIHIKFDNAAADYRVVGVGENGYVLICEKVK